SSCVHFSQGTITIKVGDKVRFNSSLSQSVTVRVSASAFGVNDTTFTIASQGSYTTFTAQTAGTYPLTTNPGACPGPGGGPTPNVAGGEGAGGNRYPRLEGLGPGGFVGAFGVPRTSQGVKSPPAGTPKLCIMAPASTRKDPRL